MAQEKKQQSSAQTLVEDWQQWRRLFDEFAAAYMQKGAKVRLAVHAHGGGFDADID